MNGREKIFLVAGVLGGIMIAVLLLFVFGARRDGANKQLPPLASGPSNQSADRMPAMAGPQSPSAAPGGAGVELSEEEQAAIGVQIATVKRVSINRKLTAVGKVEEAETQLSTISARIGGRIDKLFIDFTGQPVRRGQAIARIYSPEVVSTAEEYKLAIDNLERLGPNAREEARAQAQDLVESSKRRLELWGISKSQIQQIPKSERPTLHVTTFSTTSGVVMERKVTEGQYVKEGDPLFTVSDLSRVWVIAEVYESDISQIRTGQKVQIISDALPGSKLSGRVSFIEPVVMQQTRTLPVRIEVANAGLKLRPGMYVNTEFTSAVGRDEIAVPRTSVLDTGSGKVVYVAKGNGSFERRTVEGGPASGDLYPISSGLKEGEQVVASGTFMLDSQSRLTGGVTGMFGGSKEFSPEQAKAQAEQSKSDYKITFRTAPDPPKGGAENTFYVTVTDSDGRPVGDADVKIVQVMPAMPSMGMGEMRSGMDLKWNGKEYSGAGNVAMAGSWTVSVEVIRGGRSVATYRTRMSAR